MVGGFDMHHVLQRMANEWGYWIEILDWFVCEYKSGEHRKKTRTEPFLHRISHFHPVSVDRRTVLTDEHFGDFLGGRILIVNYPAHCHVCLRWLRLVSVVGWNYCLGSIVSRITSAKIVRADVNDESSNFV